MLADKAPGQKAHVLAKVVSVPRRRDGVHVVLQILNPGVLIAAHVVQCISHMPNVHMFCSLLILFLSQLREIH